MTHMTHSSLVHHAYWWQDRASCRSNAVKRNQTDLVMDIKLVFMVLVKEHLEQGNLAIDCN